MDVSIEIKKKHHLIHVKCYIGIGVFYRYTANGGHSGYKNNVKNTLIPIFFYLKVHTAIKYHRIHDIKPILELWIFE